MDKLLAEFKDSYVREYKNGYEIRTRNLDWGLDKAEKIIKKHNLNISILEKDHALRSFYVVSNDN